MRRRDSFLMNVLRIIDEFLTICRPAKPALIGLERQRIYMIGKLLIDATQRMFDKETEVFVLFIFIFIDYGMQLIIAWNHLRILGSLLELLS